MEIDPVDAFVLEFFLSWAFEAVGSGRATLAVSLADSALQRAHGTVGEPQALHAAGFACWAAGDDARALELLMASRAALKASPNTVVQAQVLDTLAAVVVDVEPNVRAIKTLVDDLADLEVEAESWAENRILGARAELCRAQGKWLDAMQLMETIWAHHREDRPCRSCVLTTLVTDSLAAGQPARAAEWHGRSKEFDGCSKVCSLNRQAAECRYRLHAGGSDELASAAQQYFDQASATSVVMHRRDAAHLLARAALLQSDGADPLSADHLAVRMLAFATSVRKPGNAGDFLHALLIADHWLAGVRFAAGLEPRDDLYYQASETVSTSDRALPDNELDRRVRRARASLKDARSLARRLDDVFACDWRKQEVAGRQRRLEHILRLHRREAMKE